MKIEGEKYIDGKYKIGYIFNESDCDFFKEYLIVSFSAVPAADSVIKHQYSFMRVLKDIPCNKLFIQDSLGEYGTYYMCYHMDFDLAKQINDLIEQLRIQCNVEKSKVICIGSSKGATAALYHSLYGDYGHAIAMGPQIYIASYLDSNNAVHKSILNDMIGTNDFDESCNMLNSVIIDMITNRKQTSFHLLSSENDKQFQKHIAPLLELLANNELQNDFLIDNRIQSHSDLAKYNPSFVRSKLYEIFLGMYSDYINSNFTYNNNSIIALQNHIELLISPKTEEDILRELIISYALSFSPKSITLSLDISEIYNGMKFAFYLFRNNEILVKTEYQDSPSIKFSIDNEGMYKIKYYIKYHGYTISSYTKAFDNTTSL